MKKTTRKTKQEIREDGEIARLLNPGLEAAKQTTANMNAVWGLKLTKTGRESSGRVSGKARQRPS